MIEKRPLLYFISYLSRLNFRLLSWLLQCFGHIQFKNKDAKSVLVSIFKNRKLQLVSHPPYGGYGIERVKGTDIHQPNMILKNVSKFSTFLFIFTRVWSSLLWKDLNVWIGIT